MTKGRSPEYRRVFRDAILLIESALRMAAERGSDAERPGIELTMSIVAGMKVLVADEQVVGSSGVTVERRSTIVPGPKDIEAWRMEAETAIEFGNAQRLGQFNWPWVVLSLIAEWEKHKGTEPAPPKQEFSRSPIADMEAEQKIIEAAGRAAYEGSGRYLVTRWPWGRLSRERRWEWCVLANPGMGLEHRI